MRETLEFLEDQGVQVVNITDAVYNATHIGTALDVQRYEYRELLDDYLSSPHLTGDGPCSFQELYAGNEFLILPYQSAFIHSALYSSTSNDSYQTALQGIQALTQTLRATFESNRVDAIVYPEQKNLVVKLGSPTQVGRNGILAALTGHPVVTIPAGFSGSSDAAPDGVPIGMEILGLPFSETKLLQMAWQITHRRSLRKIPDALKGFVETPDYVDVPIVCPDKDSVLPMYPIGILI